MLVVTPIAKCTNKSVLLRMKSCFCRATKQDALEIGDKLFISQNFYELAQNSDINETSHTQNNATKLLKQILFSYLLIAAQVVATH